MLLPKSFRISVTETLEEKNEDGVGKMRGSRLYVEEKYTVSPTHPVVHDGVIGDVTKSVLEGRLRQTSVQFHLIVGRVAIIKIRCHLLQKITDSCNAIWCDSCELAKLNEILQVNMVFKYFGLIFQII